MPLKIDTKPQPKTVTRTVSGSFGSFSITIRLPSIPERIKARAMWHADDKMEERMKFLLTFLAGWDDVIGADGEKVPFDNNYQTVLGPNERVLQCVIMEIAEAFDEDMTVVSEEAAKNSESPRGSTDAAGAVTQPSVSSTS